jgi:small subunit ribosomal protein S17|uniref:30S ribosomal protein S17 n=1 Tax=Candidatus Planktophila sp. TaxID=2175601 RepID=UPI00404B2214
MVTANSERNDRNDRKVREGIVVSDKMDKTITVEVSDRVKHGMYSKVLSRSSKLKAHDEQNSAGMGDRVMIMETRPLSATKRWRLVEILEKAK